MNKLSHSVSLFGLIVIKQMRAKELKLKGGVYALMYEWGQGSKEISSVYAGSEVGKRVCQSVYLSDKSERRNMNII